MRGTAATLAAGALLVLFCWMAASVSREDGITAHEIFHVTASYSFFSSPMVFAIHARDITRM